MVIYLFFIVKKKDKEIGTSNINKQKNHKEKDVGKMKKKRELEKQKKGYKKIEKA